MIISRLSLWGKAEIGGGPALAVAFISIANP
jgi:hypothetical protein